MGLFSSPKPQKSESGNQAYPWLMGQYGGWAPMGSGAMSAYSSLLGLGGGGGTGGTPAQTVDMWHDGIPGNAKAAQAAGQPTSYTIPGTAGTPSGGSGDAMGGFNNFLNSSAYQFLQDEGMRGVTNSAAGKYLLRSGATAKALQDRSSNLAKTYFDNYLNHLSDMARLSLGAGGLIGNAGQWSTGTGPTQGGMGWGLLSAGLQAAPQIISAISDVGLKDNIVDLGFSISGVPAIAFDYRRDTDFDLPEGRFLGVRAQDVQRLRPEALGPSINGYLTIIDPTLFPQRIA